MAVFVLCEVLNTKNKIVSHRPFRNTPLNFHFFIHAQNIQYTYLYKLYLLIYIYVYTYMQQPWSHTKSRNVSTLLGCHKWYQHILNIIYKKADIKQQMYDIANVLWIKYSASDKQSQRSAVYCGPWLCWRCRVYCHTGWQLRKKRSVITLSYLLLMAQACVWKILRIISSY